MLPALSSDNLPHLVRAIQRLSLRPELHDAALDLADELSGITAMVAERFTNDRTAEGVQEAFRLTVGCVSLGLELSWQIAGVASDANAGKEASLHFLNLLISQGAEQIFQTGFRAIRELDKLPADAMLFEFEMDQAAQQARLKLLFKKICLADPGAIWLGHRMLETERALRLNNHHIVECAQWLRRHHHAGVVREHDLDAEGVIAVAIIFAINGSGNIVARAGQKDFENLVSAVRQSQAPFEGAWSAWLKVIPAEHHAVLKERIALYGSNTNSLFTKIRGKSTIATLFKEFQKYAGDALEVHYDAGSDKN